jgi:hypothetical protein
VDKGQRGPQSRYACGGEEKNSQILPGLETLIIQPVAQRYTTELLTQKLNKLMRKYGTSNIRRTKSY